MADIFISYNREDRVRARQFAEAFEVQGFAVWWDNGLRSGEAFDQVIEAELKAASAVVVLWSTRSVESRWVRAEATAADRNLKLVPCAIEPCDRPIIFELLHTADLCHWQGDPGDDAWQGFLADVRRLVAAGRTGTADEIRSLPNPGAAAAPLPPNFRLPRKLNDFRPSVAIMPFRNRSSETDDEVFATGMAEDIATALSLGGEVKVIAQGATMPYRDAMSDLRAIGHELDIRYILEGNVRRVGTSLRVTAQLVETETAAITWTQRFDRPLAQLATLQEGLVEEVSAYLGVEIRQTEMDRALKKPEAMTAWEAIMRSYAAYARMTPDSTVFAVAEARRAVTLAPDYALARTALAMGLATFYVLVGDTRLLAEAVEHAEIGVQLNPGHPTVLAQAAVALAVARRWQAAHDAAERAVALNPSLIHAHQSLAITLNNFLRYDESLAHLDEAERLGPRAFQQIYTYHRRYTAQYGLGRLTDALASVSHAIQMAPLERSAQMASIVILQELGRTAEAQDAMQRVRRLAPAEPLDFWTGFMRRWFMPEVIATAFLAHFADVWHATPIAAG